MEFSFVIQIYFPKNTRIGTVPFRLLASMRKIDNDKWINSAQTLIIAGRRLLESSIRKKKKTKRLLPIEWFINSISKHDKHQFQSERHHTHILHPRYHILDSSSQPPVSPLTLERFIRQRRFRSLRTKNGLLHQNIFLHINRIFFFFFFVSHNKRSTLQQTSLSIRNGRKNRLNGPHIKIANKK